MEELYTHAQLKYVAYYTSQYFLHMNKRHEASYKMWKWKKEELHNHCTNVCKIKTYEGNPITLDNTGKLGYIKAILDHEFPVDWIIKKLKPFNIDPGQFPGMILKENEIGKSFDGDVFPPVGE